MTIILTGCAASNDTPKSPAGQPLSSSDLTKKPAQAPPTAPTQDTSTHNQTPTPMTTPATNTFDPSDRSYVNQYDGAIIHTTFGDITVKFYDADAPMAVNNFLKLADTKFYDGTKFHRVIKGFMIQGGDPNTKDGDWSNDGTGGPGYKFDNEPNNHPIVRGSIAMANAGPNTNGSQFFILTAPNYSGPYTNFGEVTKGMDVVDKIEGTPTNSMESLVGTGKPSTPRDHPIDDIALTGLDLVQKK